MSELEQRKAYRQVSIASGGLSASFEEMKMAIDAMGASASLVNNQLEKSAYLLGVTPLPRHLRAWHVARRYKQLTTRGDKE